MDFFRNWFSRHNSDKDICHLVPKMSSSRDVDDIWTHLDQSDGISIFDLPDPWPVDHIQPELQVFRSEKKSMTITYDMTPDIAIDALKIGGFLSTNRIIFVCHGFQNDLSSDWMTQIKDQLIGHSDQTVALVGWGRGAHLLPFRYRQAAANVNPVGIWLAGYAIYINHNIPGIEIWGIGHSLGAHVIGIAGRNSFSFNRITGIYCFNTSALNGHLCPLGLDPAGPCFEKRKDSNELRKTDASFVDVIHTDGYDSWVDPRDWISPVNHYGTLVPLGTIDFYPNYGYHQPGAQGFHIAGSHLRAIDMFIWSIGNEGKFKTFDELDGLPEFEKPVKKLKRSLNCVEMGFHCYFGNNIKGCYYVETNSSEPWAPVPK